MARRSHPRHERSGRLVALASALAAVATLSGCGLDGGLGGGSRAGCEDLADFGTFKNATVEILSNIRDIEAERYERAYKKFEICTGIQIEWNGTTDFEKSLQERVERRSPPDLAVLPQPGLLKTLVAKHAVTPADSQVKAAAREQFRDEWLQFGTVDGTFYAAPLSANVKSLVWYSPTMFQENGWKIPTTWKAMLDLTDRIAKSGVKPWCAGVASGPATGWPATDWLEEVVLRQAGLDTYQKWIEHRIAFDDPAIGKALDTVGSILRNPKYVNGGYGGVESIVGTSFNEAGLPILEGQCALHHQGNFYASQWPTGIEISEDGDIDAFYLPPMKGSNRPVEIGGEFLASFTQRREVSAVQRYLISPEFVNDKATLGAWISPSKALDVNNVQLATDQTSVELLQDPRSSIAFDGSDLMPSAVGGGSFWTGMVSWLKGASTEETLRTIEGTWPS